MMWLMMQQDLPEDYVVGTGNTHSVRDFLETAFNYLGIELDWQGSGTKETGIVKSVAGDWNGAITDGQTVVRIDPKYFRPTEVDILCADITKAREQLQWEPKVTFKELVRLMVDHDLMSVKLRSPGKGNEVVGINGYDWTKHQIAIHELIKE